MSNLKETNNSLSSGVKVVGKVELPKVKVRLTYSDGYVKGQELWDEKGDLNGNRLPLYPSTKYDLGILDGFNQARIEFLDQCNERN
jgi:hypothetical protein